MSSRLGLLMWVGACLLVGAIGGLSASGASSFYNALDTPPWAPPSWLFGPVWTMLYIAMGVAAWLVWRQRGESGARDALVLFVVQLLLNAIWTPLFFNLKMGALALADILLLLATLAATIWCFRRVRVAAALLLVPYLLWVTFATALTFSVWQRNPGTL